MSGNLHQPMPNERQLTLRAIIAGCLLGSVMSAVNIYVGLQTGWAVGGSLMSAIIAFAFFHYLIGAEDFSVLENNITQTAGSGAGYMSFTIGLISIFPALDMMGHEMALSTMLLWGYSVAMIGVFYAIPLRRQYIIKAQLRFPDGLATAETIMALHHAGHHDYRAAVLFRCALFAAAWTLLAFFFPSVKSLPVMTWFGYAAATTWGFSLYASPMLIGVGLIIGPRIGFSLLLGAIIAWAVLGPLVQQWGWVHGDIYDYHYGVQGWLLWPGVALIIMDAITSFLFSLNKSTFSLSSYVTTEKIEDPHAIPTKWWVTGLIIVSGFTVISMHAFFSIPYYFTLIALMLSWVLASIATRAAGETNINPASAVSKMTQMAYGALAPGQIVTNMMTAGVTQAGTSSCADMMQDLKAGYLLGASPGKQFVAQLCGCVSGVAIAIPVYYLFKTVYDIGGKDFPAPSAHAWRAAAELFSQGTHVLPEHALTAIVIASIVGFCLAAGRRLFFGHKLPSGVAIGIAFIIPAYYSIDFFLGATALLFWQKWRPENASMYAFAVASGLLVGEGLMGIVEALMKLVGG